MEYNLTSVQGGSESVMKFSSERIESPPPKPPRRRYSEQLSAKSLGAYSTYKKYNEGTQTSELKLKTCSPQPAYLSLPANLTSNTWTEYDDSSYLISNPCSTSEQIKLTKENEFYVKYFLENLKLSENIKKPYSNNRFCYKDKLQSVSQCINNDHLLSKYDCDNIVPCNIDNPLKYSANNNKTFMTSNCVNHNLKSVHKNCHRRHHSDPILSHLNFQKDDYGKFETEQCCGNASCVKKYNRYCDSRDCCSCCKKSLFIMQEIRILKEINDKLWQHLCALQNCMENMRKKLNDECTDVSVSGLLSSIYYAQKAKDSAMEERLKIVLEERDAAIHELDELMNILTKSCDYSCGEKEADKDIKELFYEMGCTPNPSKLLKCQKMLLAQIHNLKGLKQDRLSHELKQAVIERDDALEKVKQLGGEVKDLKTCCDLWHSDNKHWEVTVFDILNQVLQQRDILLSMIDNGFDICNIMYWSSIPKKMDSVDQQNISSFEARSKLIESVKNHQSVHLNDNKQHTIGTSDEISHLKEEILLLNKALESEKKRREQSEEKCVRLERLIHILRKKINGQNIGVPV